MGLLERLTTQRLHEPRTIDPIQPVECLAGNEVTTPFGDLLRIDTCEDGSVNVPEPSGAGLEYNLQVVRGIGPVTATRFHQQGVASVDDLEDHERYGTDAQEALDQIRRLDIAQLRRRGVRDAEWIHHFRAEQMLFLDIETTGLWSSSPLFLVGTLYYEKGVLVIRQYLARTPSEEKATLWAALEQLQQFEIFVSFNGKTFDLPFIQARSIEHRLAVSCSQPHVDLLHHARRQYKGVLPDCRLGTLEKEILGIKRNPEDDIPGEQIPEVYFRFAQTGNPTDIKRVLEHNRQDLVSMTHLLGLISR